MGQFKNELIKYYNVINNEVFGIGSVQQKVEIFEDKLIIIAKNKRVKSLSYLTEADHYVGELANRILIEGFKKELSELLTKKYKFDVNMIFKDYDTKTETSCTLVIMKGNIKNYFND